VAKETSGERERFWRGLIGRQHSSGLSIARFCDQAGVSPNSFFVWKRRLRSQHGGSNRGQPTSRRWKGLAERPSRRKSDSTAAGPLVPVRLISDPLHRAGAIEVEWPSGVVLRMQAGWDADMVRDVLKALAPLLVGDRASC
jgi:transposase-like protein